ncbi:MULTISPECIES: acetyl-CoA carboxylase biotin carboxylase subunit family protein [unclassified Wenzhouxiangella]|uniref:ATP-grasp domain-containing protein n=1 Tax=unclassified Wenzhouxiangella TaxID=2613841 RepID=UPI000E3266BD|nr:MULTISPECIES: D-alanine--D-alanine ligase [unclassified Wenzhouxiangella]RFF27275.1 D-alanine--D-alanine ligase [Wenzhouxiangella sp. 15181]RFP69267.1 D-alanine--D-alanine ligase [Wenzhouxiangella sp. 15190]
MKNVYVMGLDRFHLDLLETIHDDNEEYEYHALFDKSQIVHPPELAYPSMNDILAHAGELFEAAPAPPDGVMGYWDLPTSLAVPLVAREFGLPGAPLAAVAKCEHKYWSRIEQRKAVPEVVGRFQAIDPFADDPLAGLELDYPFWFKPIKSHSSFLGFHVDSRKTFEQHLPQVRKQIGIMARPMNQFLEHVDVPDEIAPIDGYHCIIEEIVSQGEQCTLEGYCWEGEVLIFGVIDSKRFGKHGSSFSHYQYPSALPVEVQERMIEIARKVMRHFGYDGAAFNIEFYWDPDADTIRLLEINARISKSHSPLFLMVDGVPNQKVVLDLALGRRPAFPYREGDFHFSGKFMLRYFEDGIIERVPNDRDIARVQAKYPEARIRVLASQGTALSDLELQDSYSFEVAEIFLGADNEDDLLVKYEEVRDLLDFRIRPFGPEAA